MGRMARVVVPDVPHHITQRGNRRQLTFFSGNDYQQYINIMSQSCTQHNVEIWAYCLMPNHVHLIAVPSQSDSLRLAIGEAHRQYTRMINFSHGWRGHLWQERFFSFPMDESHLLAAARYIELNPVRAGLVTRPGDYKWSSARAHIGGEDDNLIKAEP
jgi:putative transposase